MPGTYRTGLVETGLAGRGVVRGSDLLKLLPGANRLGALDAELLGGADRRRLRGLKIRKEPGGRVAVAEEAGAGRGHGHGCEGPGGGDEACGCDGAGDLHGGRMDGWTGGWADGWM